MLGTGALKWVIDGLHFISVSSDSVVVTWLPPAQPNGRLVAYRYIGSILGTHPYHTPHSGLRYILRYSRRIPTQYRELRYIPT